MKGRGTTYNPQNRFEEIRYENFDDEWQNEKEGQKTPTKYFRDTTKSPFAKNNSPDIGFTYDLNPYRGCEHGCIYCYARPSHEYLGFSSGIDFETKIMVKENLPELIEKEFQKPKWQPSLIALSGNTDCYQPIERKLQITRRCLEIFLRYRHPVFIITKNALILRDRDILSELAKHQLVSVRISVTTLDKNLARTMEPRTAIPEQRLHAIEELSKAGISVGVNVAPIIPGLNDEEIPEILKQAAEHGATSASYTIVRLPYAVKDLFVEWVNRELPTKAERILNRIGDVRDGKLYDSQFSKRMVGEGEIANAIKQLFFLSCKKLGLNKKKIELSTDKFLRKEKPQTELKFL